MNEELELQTLTILDMKQNNKESLGEIFHWLKQSRNQWKDIGNKEMVKFVSELTLAVINTELTILKARK